MSTTLPTRSRRSWLPRPVRMRISAISASNWSMRLLVSVIVCAPQAPMYSEDNCASISAGAPLGRHPPVHHDRSAVGDARAPPGRTARPRGSTRPRGDLRHHLVELLDDERRQAHRQLVEQQERGSRWRARGTARASAARRPTACRPAACGAPRAAGTGRTRSPRPSRASRRRSSPSTGSPARSGSGRRPCPPGRGTRRAGRARRGRRR